MKLWLWPLIAAAVVWLALSAWVVHKTHERVSCYYDAPESLLLPDCRGPSAVERFVRKVNEPFWDI